MEYYLQFIMKFFKHQKILLLKKYFHVYNVCGGVGGSMGVHMCI